MQKCKERRGRGDSRTTPQIHMNELQEKKGKHSFPYTNSVKSEYNMCLNCCVKLI